MSYNLSISLSSNDLQQIYAMGQTVVLVKSVECAMPEMSVAWVSFQPLMSNQVSWNTDFQAFASNTQVMANVVINPTYQANVGFGQCIPFTSQGFGTPESGASGSNSMSVINEASQQQISTGLSQASSVNGASLPATPICALSLMKQMMATLTPLESVRIFMANNTNSGTVLANVPSNACTVSFDGGTTSRSVIYNSATGCFQSA